MTEMLKITLEEFLLELTDESMYNHEGVSNAIKREIFIRIPIK